MKKAGSLFAALVAVMIMFLGSASIAEETKTTLGVKAWISSWEDKNATGTQKYNSIAMIGPAVEVKFENNMFLKGALLFGTVDHEYSYFVSPADNEQNTISSRKDLDLVAGYMITPRLGAFVGYKSRTADFTFESPIGTVVLMSDIKIKGPGIGILGNIPISETVALYGSLSWMVLDTEATWAGGSSSEESDGPSAEIGVAFNTSPQTAINVGYKYEKFSGSYSDGSGSFDEMLAGVTVGFNYRF